VSEIVSAERSGRPLTFVKAEAPPVNASPKRHRSPPPSSRSARSTAFSPAIPGPRVKLTLSANYDAFLERRIGREHVQSNYVAYHFICQVPCTDELPPTTR
jgi:hypothetical protein